MLIKTPKSQTVSWLPATPTSPQQILVTPAPSTISLTPIPLTNSGAGYSLTVLDSQPIVPPGTLYTVPLSCAAPAGNAAFTSLTTGGAPFGVTIVPNLTPGSPNATLTLAVTGEAVPGAYTYSIQAGILTAVVNITAGLTIGPAWPPPQTLTGDGAITLTTDAPAYACTQGDTIDIQLYEEGFTATNGIMQFFLSEQAPVQIGGLSPLFNTFWCTFPSNAAPATYTPTPGTPTLITTAQLVTTLVMTPGLYAFTISDAVPTLNPAYMTLTQTGTPTTNPNFSIALSGEPTANGTPYYAYAAIDITAKNSWLGWVTFSFDAPAGITVRDEFTNPNEGGAGLQIFVNPDLAPGNYTITVTGTSGTDTATVQLTLAIANLSSPYNGTNSVTFAVQVLSAGSQAATAIGTALTGYLKPKGAPGAGKRTGAIAIQQRGQTTLRATTTPVNPNTPYQSTVRARHLSRVANIKANTLSQADAWAAAAAAFPGHDLIPRDLINGIGFMTTYLPMTPAQFQYMVQATQQDFGSPVTLNPPTPTPWFPQAMSLNATAVYDRNYSCVGFALTYTYLPYGNQFGGFGPNPPAPASYIISATSSTASSKSAKSGSGFAVIAYYTGPPTPQQLLADWKTAYGTLPEKGTIYFSVRPADPISGVTGMALVEGRSYENGTLEGATLPQAGDTYATNPIPWYGPFIFSIFAAQAGTVNPVNSGETLTVPPGGATDTQLFVQGSPAPGGGDWTADEPYSGTVTFKGEITSTAVAGKTEGITETAQPTPPITITFNPSTIDIPSGNTTPVATTATITVPAGTPNGIWLFKLEATDGRQTLSDKFTITVDSAAPATSGLSLAPLVAGVPIVSGNDLNLNFTLSNPNATSQILEIFPPAEIEYTSGVGFDGWITFSITSGGNPITVPAGTPANPGTAAFTLTIHPTGNITTGRKFALFLYAANLWVQLVALLSMST
jgi:hypothetical protein